MNTTVDSITNGLLRDRSYTSAKYNLNDPSELARQLEEEFEISSSVESSPKRGHHPTESSTTTLDSLNKSNTTLRDLVPELFESRLRKLGDAYELNLTIERTLADSKLNDTNALLSLPQFEQLKTQVEDLKAERKTLINQNKGSLSSAFIDELISLDTTLENSEERLKSHYLKVGELGYVHDVLLDADSKLLDQNLGSTLESSIETALEDMVSTVISLSIQQNIQLPEPDLNTMKTLEGRIHWCSACISSLVTNQTNQSPSLPPQSPSPITTGGRSTRTNSHITSTTSTGVSFSSPSNQTFFTAPENYPNNDNDSPISEYHDLKTAFTDLQFAHNYLTKQYSEERKQYEKSLNQLRYKLTHSQEQMISSKGDLIKYQNACSSYEMKLRSLTNQLQDSRKEVLKLTKDNNLLKVDHLGEMVPSTISSNESILPHSAGSNTSIPSTPIDYDCTMNTSTNGSSYMTSPRNSVSASILRMEFKKLVNRMNEKFEAELEKERVEKKRLQDLLKLYEEKDKVQ